MALKKSSSTEVTMKGLLNAMFKFKRNAVSIKGR